MNAVSIGPLVFSAGHASAIAGFIALVIATAVMSRLWDRRFSDWAGWTLIATVAGARLGHVIENAGSFLAEPWRVVFFWQSGFEPVWAIPFVIAVTAWKLPRWRLRAGALGPLGLAVAVWAGAFAMTGRVEPLPVPDRVYERYAGAPATLAPDGRPLVVNLWATWCPPCVREMPMLAEAAEDTPGARFVFANQGESEAAVERFLARQELELGEIVLDPGNSLMAHYDAAGLPVTLFIGEYGVLRHAHVGEISREQLDARVRALGGR